MSNNNEDTDFELGEAIENAALVLVLLLGSVVAITAVIAGIDLFEESGEKLSEVDEKQETEKNEKENE